MSTAHSGSAAASAYRFVKLVADVKTRVAEVSAQALAAELAAGATPLLIDVREAEELAKGTLPGALPLPRGVLEGRIEQAVPDPATPLSSFTAPAEIAPPSPPTIFRKWATPKSAPSRAATMRGPAHRSPLVLLEKIRRSQAYPLPSLDE